MIIGITGISGAGKSTVTLEICKIKNGIHINADLIVKELQRSGNEYYERIVQTFGKEILREDKELDRKKLAEIVFSDKRKKEILDKLTLDYVVPEIKKKAIEASNGYIAVIDAPLLFEFKLNEICDMTIGVLSSEETCIKRICKRDKIDEIQAKSRISNQKKEKFFKINCDFCISNDLDDNLEKQINEILERKKSI